MACVGSTGMPEGRRSDELGVRLLGGWGVRAFWIGMGIPVILSAASDRRMRFGGGLVRRLLTDAWPTDSGLSSRDAAAIWASLPATTVGVRAGEGGRTDVLLVQLSSRTGCTDWGAEPARGKSEMPVNRCSHSWMTVSTHV